MTRGDACKEIFLYDLMAPGIKDFFHLASARERGNAKRLGATREIFGPCFLQANASEMLSRYRN